MYIDFEHNTFRLEKEELANKELANWYFGNRVFIEYLLGKYNSEIQNDEIIDADFDISRLWENYKNQNGTDLRFKSSDDELDFLKRLDYYIKPYLKKNDDMTNAS